MDRLNHHHLYIFWTLARQGTFTKAAETLRIAQSAVTSQVQSLEKTLGMELIDRSNRRKPTLTDGGKRVLEFADMIFEASTELLEWAKQGELRDTQILRIGALSGLSRNLQYEFLKPILSNPKVKFEVTTGDQAKLVRLLREHALDMILSTHNVQSEDVNRSFHTHVLTRSPLVFVTHSKDTRRNMALREMLLSRPLYVPGANFEARPELEAFLERMKCKHQIAGEIDDIALLRIFALRSGGVVVLPQLGVQNDIDDGSVLVLGGAGKIEQRFYAITRQRQYPSKIIESLISSIREI